MTDDFCVLRGAKVTLRDNSCVTVNSPWLKCSKDKKLQKHVNCVTGGEDFISMDRHEQALPVHITSQDKSNFLPRNDLLKRNRKDTWFQTR